MERKDDSGSIIEETINRRTFLKKLVGLGGSSEKASLLDTVKLSTAFSIALIATSPVAIQTEQSSGIKIGNSGTLENEKFLRENPGIMFSFGSFVAPVFEEGLFRAIPSFILSKLSRIGTMWRVGIPSSFIFAGAHNIGVEQEQVKFDLNTVPLYQFGTGLFLWKLFRERGYLHAVVAHSVINTIAFTTALFLPDSTSSQDLPK